MPVKHHKKVSRWIGILPLAVLLAACGAPREETMQERHVPGLFTRSLAEMGVISTGGAHRVITFRVNPENSNKQPAGAFCAEPPPDAVEAVAARLAADLAARVPVGVQTQVATAEAEVAYERAFTTAVLAMTRRSQGLQYARDQTTAACQDYLNGRIGRDVYVRWREKVMNESQQLVKAEIARLPPMPGSVAAPALPNRAERRGLPTPGGGNTQGGGASSSQKPGSSSR